MDTGMFKNINEVIITESYVYLVLNKITGHWYIGRQIDVCKIIGKNYFTGSISKRKIAKWFQESFCKESETLHDWDIFILYQGDKYKEYEEKWIDFYGMHNAKNNPLSLNFNDGNKTFTSIKGENNHKNKAVGAFYGDDILIKVYYSAIDAMEQTGMTADD